LTASSAPPAADTRRHLWRAAQALISLGVLALLIRDVDREALAQTIRQGHPGWLLAALVTKAASLVLHEVRLWSALPPPRPRWRRVLAIGLASGVLNLVLPGRAGDFAAVAMLRQRAGVPAPQGAAAVGVVALLEALVFGALLVGVLAAGAGQWRDLLGAEVHADALRWVGAATLGVGVVVASAGLIARALEARLGRGPLPRLRKLAREALTGVSTTLGTVRGLGRHVGLAAAQVATLVTAFALGLPAVGLGELPWMAAAGVLGISSLAAVVLPPGYGAGPAAASALVLGALGASRGDALAYAAVYWVLSQAPAVVLGVPPLAWLNKAAPGKEVSH